MEVTVSPRTITITAVEPTYNRPRLRWQPSKRARPLFGAARRFLSKSTLRAWIIQIAKPVQKQAAKFAVKDQKRMADALLEMAADPFAGDTLRR